MHQLERRIAAAERRGKIATRFVWRNLGETPNEAITKIGGALVDDVTVIGWLDQAEAVHRKEMTLFHYFDNNGRE